jgi:hypothetical protein
MKLYCDLLIIMEASHFHALKDSLFLKSEIMQFIVFDNI